MKKAILLIIIETFLIGVYGIIHLAAAELDLSKLMVLYVKKSADGKQEELFLNNFANTSERKLITYQSIIKPTFVNKNKIAYMIYFEKSDIEQYFCVYDLIKNKEERLMAIYYQFDDIVVSPNGRYVFVNYGNGGYTYLINLETNNINELSNKDIRTVQFSNNSKELFYTTYHDTFVLDIETNNIAKRELSFGLMSNSGDKIVSSGGLMGINIYDFKKKENIHYNFSANDFSPICWSADDKTLIWEGGQGTDPKGYRLNFVDIKNKNEQMDIAGAWFVYYIKSLKSIIYDKCLTTDLEIGDRNEQMEYRCIDDNGKNDMKINIDSSILNNLKGSIGPRVFYYDEN